MTITKSNNRSATVRFAEETLTLLSQRAVWWARQETLFVADLHFGKEATFRAAGIPIPDQTAECLARLSSAIDETDARRLIVLGDLIHARRGRCAQTFEAITEWRLQRPELQIELVRGNHDQSSGDPPAAWEMQCVSEPRSLAPFTLRHYSEATSDQFVLAGHLHPTVRLKGRGGDSAKLPCFLLRDNVLTLPAFSTFVDGAAIRATAADQIFGICEGDVLKLQ
jgi:DNA ligase-associated metallophosphoesterase